MRLVILMIVALSAFGQAPSNSLSLNWLVREDIFAGLLENDRLRLEKGAETLDRVGSFYGEAQVLPWRYGVEVVRAVWALEAKDEQAFHRHYGIALTYL